jgi:hypothetical protein
MLATAFTSQQAHDRLVRALGLSERLLGCYGEALPAMPPLERRKSPREVFEVLWQTCDPLQQFVRGAGLHALELRRGYLGEEPSDVYDLASLIVSELEYVASFLPHDDRPLLTVVGPSPTLPCHNFRRGRQLHAAVTLLATSAHARPEVLKTAGKRR